MVTALRVQFVSFVMDIYGAKFQEHCFNISRDIVYSVFTTFPLQYYDIITNLICIIEKRQYLENEKRYFEKKMPFFCTLKGLSNKQKYIHFKRKDFSSNTFTWQMRV